MSETEPIITKMCPRHKPVQHRDMQPPWCNECGWSDYIPAVPARLVHAKPRKQAKDAT